MAKKKNRHLKPIKDDPVSIKDDPVSILHGITQKYEEVYDRSLKVNNALKSVSESNLLNNETRCRLSEIIHQNESKTLEFKQSLNITTKKIKKRNKKNLSIHCGGNETQCLGEKCNFTINQKIQNAEYNVNEMICNLMTKKLDKDWELNPDLSHLQMIKIQNNIVRLEKTIYNYRRYFGKNPLKWTPSERKTMGSMYSVISKEYGLLGYEQGRDQNRLIADNLLNNPLNKLRMFNIPSAPRGSNNVIFIKKFVD